MGDVQSTQRGSRQDAAAEEQEGREVDNPQTEQNTEHKTYKNSQQSSDISSKGDEVKTNGCHEDENGAQGLPLIPTKEEAPETQVNKEESQGDVDANDGVHLEITELDVKQNDMNSLGRFFNNIGLKLTIKRGSGRNEGDNNKEAHTEDSEESKTEKTEDKTEGEAEQDSPDPTCPILTAENVLENVDKTAETTEEPELEAESEQEPYSTSPTGPGDVEIDSPIRRFFATGMFAGLWKQKEAGDETAEKELEGMGENQVTETTGHAAQEQRDEEPTTPGELRDEIPGKSPEPDISGLQERDRAQMSPLLRFLSGSSLKRLSMKQRNIKSSEARLCDFGENPAELLASEPAEEHRKASAPTSADAAKEEEGAWASFKRFMSPKVRMKKSNHSAEEAQQPASVEEPRAEQSSDLSPEEGKKRKNSSVSWEAVLCGSGRRRSRKTSDSEDEMCPIDLKHHKEDGKPRSGEDSGAENEKETTSPKLDGSPQEEDGGSTWKSLKRIVTPKRKSRDEDEAIKFKTQSDGESGQENSSFSIKNLLPGRKKQRSEEIQGLVCSDEAETDQASDDEDSETPGVVPLSEFVVDGEEIYNQNLQEKEKVQLQQDQSAEVNLCLPQDFDKHSGKQDTNEEADDVTELASEHQQLSDIPEEGVMTEPWATLASLAEEAPGGEDTMVEELIEATSEAITAPEPAADLTLQDETEMFSAASQLSSESATTSGNATPVPAEGNAVETDTLLHRVAETFSASPQTTTPEPEQAFEGCVRMESTILETHRRPDATSTETGLNGEELQALDGLVSASFREGTSELAELKSGGFRSGVAIEEFDSTDHTEVEDKERPSEVRILFRETEIASSEASEEIKVSVDIEKLLELNGCTGLTEDSRQLAEASQAAAEPEASQAAEEPEASQAAEEPEASQAAEEPEASQAASSLASDKGNVPSMETEQKADDTPKEETVAEENKQESIISKDTLESAGASTISEEPEEMKAVWSPAVGSEEDDVQPPRTQIILNADLNTDEDKTETKLMSEDTSEALDNCKHVSLALHPNREEPERPLLVKAAACDHVPEEDKVPDEAKREPVLSDTELQPVVPSETVQEAEVSQVLQQSEFEIILIEETVPGELKEELKLHSGLTLEPEESSETDGEADVLKVLQQTESGETKEELLDTIFGEEKVPGEPRDETTVAGETSREPVDESKTAEVVEELETVQTSSSISEGSSRSTLSAEETSENFPKVELQTVDAVPEVKDAMDVCCRLVHAVESPSADNAVENEQILKEDEETTEEEKVHVGDEVEEKESTTVQATEASHSPPGTTAKEVDQDEWMDAEESIPRDDTTVAGETSREPVDESKTNQEEELETVETLLVSEGSNRSSLPAEETSENFPKVELDAGENQAESVVVMVEGSEDKPAEEPGFPQTVQVSSLESEDHSLHSAEAERTSEIILTEETVPDEPGDERTAADETSSEPVDDSKTSKAEELETVETSSLVREESSIYPHESEETSEKKESDKDKNKAETRLHAENLKSEDAARFLQEPEKLKSVLQAQCQTLAKKKTAADEPEEVKRVLTESPSEKVDDFTTLQMSSFESEESRSPSSGPEASSENVLKADLDIDNHEPQTTFITEDTPEPPDDPQNAEEAELPPTVQPSSEKTEKIHDSSLGAEEICKNTPTAETLPHETDKEIMINSEDLETVEELEPERPSLVKEVTCDHVSEEEPIPDEAKQEPILSDSSETDGKADVLKVLQQTLESETVETSSFMSEGSSRSSLPAEETSENFTKVDLQTQQVKEDKRSGPETETVEGEDHAAGAHRDKCQSTDVSEEAPGVLRDQTPEALMDAMQAEQVVKDEDEAAPPSLRDGAAEEVEEGKAEDTVKLAVVDAGTTSDGTTVDAVPEVKDAMDVCCRLVHVVESLSADKEVGKEQILKEDEETTEEEKVHVGDEAEEKESTTVQATEASHSPPGTTAKEVDQDEWMDAEESKPRDDTTVAGETSREPVDDSKTSKAEELDTVETSSLIREESSISPNESEETSKIILKAESDIDENKVETVLVAEDQPDFFQTVGSARLESEDNSVPSATLEITSEKILTEEAVQEEPGDEAAAVGEAIWGQETAEVVKELQTVQTYSQKEYKSSSPPPEAGETSKAQTVSDETKEERTLEPVDPESAEESEALMAANPTPESEHPSLANEATWAHISGEEMVPGEPKEETINEILDATKPVEEPELIRDVKIPLFDSGELEIKANYAAEAETETLLFSEVRFKPADVQGPEVLKTVQAAAFESAEASDQTQVTPENIPKAEPATEEEDLTAETTTADLQMQQVREDKRSGSEKETVEGEDPAAGARMDKGQPTDVSEEAPGVLRDQTPEALMDAIQAEQVVKDEDEAAPPPLRDGAAEEVEEGKAEDTVELAEVDAGTTSDGTTVDAVPEVKDAMDVCCRLVHAVESLSADKEVGKEQILKEDEETTEEEKVHVGDEAEEKESTTVQATEASHSPPGTTAKEVDQDEWMDAEESISMREETAASLYETKEPLECQREDEHVEQVGLKREVETAHASKIEAKGSEDMNKANKASGFESEEEDFQVAQEHPGNRSIAAVTLTG